MRQSMSPVLDGACNPCRFNNDLDACALLRQLVSPLHLCQPNPVCYQRPDVHEPALD
jgi:hypothetical protein